MKVFLAILLTAGLFACENSTSAKVELDSTKKEIDTFVNKIKNSEVVDTIKSKGGVILDSMKSKGGKLIDKVDIKLSKKDSTK